jgi:hypothetical protein
MKKVLLLLLLVLLFLSVPTLRSAAAPVIDPIGAGLAVVLEPLIVKVRTPFYEWKAKDETRAIVKLLRDQEALGQRLPTRRDFADWLRRRHRANPTGLDPWGMPYYIKYSSRGAAVGSAGADLEPDTPDDIIEVLPSRLR